MSAATRLRRNDESARIVVFERGEHVSFANCGLPYVIGGVITDREDVLLQTPGGLRDRFDIEVMTRHEVLAIHPAAQQVVVRNLTDGSVRREAYDDLVLSPGARPVVPPIPGVERAMTLRDVADLDAVLAALESAGRAVVIGGGFIGLEMAENLVRRGLAVTVIEAADQVMAPLDPELAVLVQDELERNGVEVCVNAQVEEISPDDVVLADGRRVPAELVVLAIGVQPESALAAAAGLTLGPRGAIVVDAQQRTSAPHVFAVGDAVVKHDDLGAEVLVPLANTANRQGRLVADVISGEVVGTGGLRATRGAAVLGVFGVVAAVSGESEKRVRARGVVPEVIHTHPTDHASYFPGAEGMHLKLVIDPVTDRILGIQGVGGAGVDKRIDVVTTAMAGHLRASELADLELAYAPQFGSAKDPVNMLGYIAENVRDGATSTIQWDALEAAMRDGATLIDIRTPEERSVEAIPGSISVPLDELRNRLDELPPGDLIVHCAVGQRGHSAARMLAQHGRRVRNLDGGLQTWAAGRRAQQATDRKAATAPPAAHEGDADAA
jgi:NADPH-dependent 2,4-dienoyl-CoA reductase/sulfur reductase-like enzyme/rhodanese-related sulfurtransferase